MNEAALRTARTQVESLVGGVGQLVEAGVSRCQERVRQQQALSLQDKESLLELLVRTKHPHPVTSQHSFYQGEFIHRLSDQHI